LQPELSSRFSFCFPQHRRSLRRFKTSRQGTVLNSSPSKISSRFPAKGKFNPELMPQMLSGHPRLAGCLPRIAPFLIQRLRALNGVDLCSNSPQTKPYHETRWLVFHGEFLEPKNLAGQKARINLSKCDYLNEAERTKNTRHYEEEPPTSVGTLYKEETDFWCLLFFPEDAADLVLQIASANKVKAITQYGDKLRYKQAPIFSFSLKEKIEEDP